MPTGIEDLDEFYLEPTDAVAVPCGDDLKEIAVAYRRVSIDLMLMAVKCDLFDKPKLKIGTYSISDLECLKCPECNSFIFGTCDGEVRIDMWRVLIRWRWSSGRAPWRLRVKGSQKALAGLLMAWKSVMDKLDNVYKARNHQLGELVKAATEFNQICKEHEDNAG